ncbi:MAG: hypothetical protein H0X67_01200 [Acidobacteria bacterium]|nr:hypothetical protein [Acidobacteriota bacterium]
MHTLRFATSLWPYAVVTTLAAMVPTLFWRGGILENEATYFILQYTAERPLLHKIFDPHTNDFHTYQARELSYFVDYLDAMVYTTVTGRIEPSFFIPGSAILAWVLFALVFMRATRSTARHIDPLTGALVLACFASSFVFISTFGMFYRSGKLLVGVAVIAFLFHLRRVQQARSRDTPMRPQWLTRQGLVAFSLTLVAGLLDRQGVFYALMACAILLLHFVRTRELRDLLLAAGAATVLLQVYNLWLAPVLIHRLNGYWPSFEYQTIPGDQIALLPAHTLAASQMLAENASVLLGGTWPVTIAFLGVVIVLLLRAHGRATQKATSSWRLPELLRGISGCTVAYVALVAIGHIVMFALMIARHPYIYDLDHRYWYYPIPYLAVLVFAGVGGLNAVLSRSGPRERQVIQVALLVVVIGNLANLPYYSRFMTGGGHFEAVFAQTELLKASLRQNRADPGLVKQYEDFFRHAAPLRRSILQSSGER